MRMPLEQFLAELNGSTLFLRPIYKYFNHEKKWSSWANISKNVLTISKCDAAEKKY